MLSSADLLEMRAIEQARGSFWAYRQYMNPKMKKGWWQRVIAHHLQQFYIDLTAGLRPKLVIQAPPQHGKSEQAIDFLAWVAGQDPDLRAIYTSFSERLGIRANLKLQRAFDSEKYKKIFPCTKINSTNVVTVSAQTLRNREILEYVGRDGYFRNTTVRGSITGEGLDIGVMDDPIKGREEAGSKTVRNKTWDWLLDDFFTRFSENAGFLAILTRWHVDDPIGRLIEQMPDVRVVSYPAIATEDEEFRTAGEALFPEHKSLDFLLERKGVMGSANWEALYQQNPVIVGGSIIKSEWYKTYRVLPVLQERRIYADTAMKTKEHNDWSVFECWGKNATGIYLVDAIRGKWEAPELERQAIAFWAKMMAMDVVEFGRLTTLKVEDKSSGTGLVQGLKQRTSIPIIGIPRHSDKYTRYSGGLMYIESGRVFLPENHPVTSVIYTESEQFTANDSHQFDDSLDPMFDAIDDFFSGNKTVWDIL